MQLNNEDIHLLYMSLVIVTLIPYSFPVLCFLYHKSALLLCSFVYCCDGGSAPFCSLFCKEALLCLPLYI